MKRRTIVAMLVAVAVFVAWPAPARSQSIGSPRAASVLFRDDFSGDLSRWNAVTGTWETVDGQLKGVGEGGGIDAWIYAGDVAWTDYALDLEYFGDAIVNFAIRSTGHWINEYRIDVCATPHCHDLGYGFSIYRNGNNTPLGGGDFASAPHDGNAIRIEVEGNALRLYVNGHLAGSVSDPNPLPSGRFALAVSGASTLRFDDVVVTALGCGNGVLQPDRGEECDDGNRNPRDGCTNACTICGNGAVTEPEACDDGNLIDGDGCNAGCGVPLCGDGVVSGTEQCDDGDTDPNDGCTTGCTICGNGTVTPPEGCDDGNLVSGDGCDADCLGPDCGNGRLDGDEECDDGGICIGSANAGTFCTAHRQCPDGTCTTFGGDGCAANCTLERAVRFDLVPGVVDESALRPNTSGAILHTDVGMVPLPSRGAKTFILGKERDGQIPFVAKPEAVSFPPIQGYACNCIRGVARKTCGGTLLEVDGVTPSADCTPGYTAGDSVCVGKSPCTFVHGAGNALSGVIGCNGLDGVNVTLTQDAGPEGRQPAPPRIAFSGHGGPGSAALFVSSAQSVVWGLCSYQGPEFGTDGQFCTDDDPQAHRGTAMTTPAVTGEATVEVDNAADLEGNTLGPFSIRGVALDCAALVAGRASEGAFAGVAIQIDTAPVGDSAVTNLLVFRLCGNGALDPGEACDTGGESATCDDDCTPVLCGDGNVNATAGEGCDDGNRNDTDACRNDCQPSVCGDGILRTGVEVCDDGNLTSGDGCDENCTPTLCGNGVVTAGEQCDDGNTTSEDGCSAACRSELCGDGVRQSGLGEQCDDGNTVNGDGCDANCTPTACGNGVVTTGEQCDDGNTTSEDGCSAVCRSELCGDGVRQSGLGEQCDDGNLVNGDACEADCTLPRCGNGIVDTGEECDDGNGNPSDGCTNACTICGNRTVTPPERCDDGNLVDTDGCDAACRVATVVVGVGTPASCTEAALDAALAGGRALTFNCGPDPVTIIVTRTKAIGADTTIDGGGRITISGGYSVGVFSVDAGATFTAQHLTIANGQSGAAGGGAIYNNGTVAVTDSTFSDNGSACDFIYCGGGAIYNEGTLTVTNGTFSYNTAFGGDSGGAIYNAGTLTVTNSTFSGNRAPDGDGGAIYNAYNDEEDGGTLMTVTNSAFSGNSAADWGGAIYNEGTLTVTNCTFSRNRAEGGGGAIDNLWMLTVTNSTFSGNRATDEGGGAIYNDGDMLIVTSSTFSGNRTDGYGGAIDNESPLTVANSSFSGNHAELGGGAIANDPAGELTVTNSTFSGNRTSDEGEGGAIYNFFGTLTVTNTIVANSTNGGDCVSYADADADAVVDGGHNLIEDAANSCGLMSGENGTLVGVDPKLDTGGLKDNGGPTHTIALLPGSPAINAGDGSVCATAPVNGLDQRGYVRPGTGATNCSIGAYEYNSPGPLVGCVGDCKGDGAVTVDELITMVLIALGSTPVSTCPAGDTNGDGSITVDDIIVAVNAALTVCPPGTGLLSLRECP